MRVSRRSILGASAGAWCATRVSALAAPPPAVTMGLVIHCFAVHTAGELSRAITERFSSPARFLKHALSLGAGGIQVSFGVLDDDAADGLRKAAAAASMYLEGIVSLPRDQTGLERFELEIRTAKRAGAQVVRTVLLSGRRYEAFTTLGAFRRFAEESANSLKLAAAVVAREGIDLAVENHKDWRAHELLGILKENGNERVGVCLDTGNSIALLEDPMEVIETLAPRAFTTHFKDMALEEYKDGFLLAEVPFGTGVLDLPRALRILRAARPKIRINLEMITRNPLKVPCLSESYWATFPELPGKEVARTLALVRGHPPSRPLAHISQLPREDQLRIEDHNVVRCIDFARDHLGL